MKVACVLLWETKTKFLVDFKKINLKTGSLRAPHCQYLVLSVQKQETEGKRFGKVVSGWLWEERHKGR